MIERELGERLSTVLETGDRILPPDEAVDEVAAQEAALWRLAFEALRCAVAGREWATRGELEAIMAEGEEAEARRQAAVEAVGRRLAEVVAVEAMAMEGGGATGGEGDPMDTDGGAAEEAGEGDGRRLLLPAPPRAATPALCASVGGARGGGEEKQGGGGGGTGDGGAERRGQASETGEEPPKKKKKKSTRGQLGSVEQSLGLGFLKSQPGLGRICECVIGESTGPTLYVAGELFFCHACSGRSWNLVVPVSGFFASLRLSLLGLARSRF